MKRTPTSIAANLCTLAALALVAAPAGAQSTGKSAISAADRAFMVKAAQDDIGEIAAGTLAGQNASSNTVRLLGKRFADDHRNNLMQLSALAQQYSVTLPTQPAPEDQRVAQRLSSLSGTAFDAEFLRVQQRDHMKSIAAFKSESSSGTSAAVVAFAKASIPVLDEHVQLATEDAGRLKLANQGAGSQDGMASMNGMNGAGGPGNAGASMNASNDASTTSGSNAGAAGASPSPTASSSAGPRAGAEAGTNTATSSNLNGNTGPVHVAPAPSASPSPGGSTTGSTGTSSSSGSSSSSGNTSAGRSPGSAKIPGTSNGPGEGAAAGTNTATSSNLNGNTGPVPLPTPSPSPSASASPRP